MQWNGLSIKLRAALHYRADFLEPTHTSAFRAFNGFLEGFPDLVIEIYADTLVIFNFAADPTILCSLIPQIKQLYLELLPWLRCVLVKTRHAQDPIERRGKIICGQNPSQRIRENEIWYSLNLTMHQDSSFYLDTRSLRQWLYEHAQGWNVLNTFAYTGSLGIASLAGGAQRVIQTDRNGRFLSIARQSARLNGFSVHPKDCLVEDFFTSVSRFRHSHRLFECAIIDPPFFSQTNQGTVDLQTQSHRIINKVRPLVKDGGSLIAINNSLFLSGADYLQGIELLASDGYLAIAELIPVGSDCTGYPQTISGTPPADPAPFNHSTKIAILRIRRKIP